MKKYILVFLVCISIFSCKKDNNFLPSEKLIKTFNIEHISQNYEYNEDKNLSKMIITLGSYYLYEYSDSIVDILVFDKDNNQIESGYLVLNNKGYAKYSYMYNPIPNDTTYYEYFYDIDDFLIRFNVIGQGYSYSFIYTRDNGNIIKWHREYTESWMTEPEITEKVISYSNVVNYIDFENRGIKFYGKPTPNLPSEEKSGDLITKFDYNYDNDGSVVRRFGMLYFNNEIIDSTVINITYY